MRDADDRLTFRRALRALEFWLLVTAQSCDRGRSFMGNNLASACAAFLLAIAIRWFWS